MAVTAGVGVLDEGMDVRLGKAMAKEEKRASAQFRAEIARQDNGNARGEALEMRPLDRHPLFECRDSRLGRR